MFVSIRRSIVVCAFALSFVASLVLGTQSAQAQTATLQTDLNDYHPGDEIVITGAGFSSNEGVSVVVVPDPNNNPGLPAYQPWSVVANSAGGFTANWLVPLDAAGKMITITATGQTSGQTAQKTVSDHGGYDLSQCRNGGPVPPNSNAVSCANGAWAHGNAGAQNAHYAEGGSIAYRAEMTGLANSTEYVVDLAYDIVNSSNFAIDYLTSAPRVCGP